MRFPVIMALSALALGPLALGGCEKALPQTVSHTPALNMARLDAEIGEIAQRAAPGVLGVGLMNLESGQNWVFNGARRFPMQSVFKAPLAAAVLAEVDGGRLSLDEVITLGAQDLSPPHSPIAEAWPGRRAYSVRELLIAAAGGSDNTAADVLMARIGGPGAVSAWLQAKHIEDLRVDRYERELQPEIAGMASFRPEWRGSAAFSLALAATPPDRRRRATLAYLTDPRDTATPAGMLDFFYKLKDGGLLRPASRKLFLQILTETPSAPGRLKAGLPADAQLAHKSGTARTDLGITPATNDVGVVTLADGRSYALVVFLAGSPQDEAARDRIIADVARAVVHSLG